MQEEKYRLTLRYPPPSPFFPFITSEDPRLHKIVRIDKIDFCNILSEFYFHYPFRILFPLFGR